MKNISIKFIKNGPIKIVNNTEHVLKNIFFFNNKNIEINGTLFICRCGRSQNQPFCDGTHKKVNFSSQNLLENDNIQEYPGKDISIIFNRSICAGSSSCVNKFSNIYKAAQENWVNPDSGSIDEVIESIKNCPSGALSYELNGNKNFEEYNETRISLLNRNPITVIGKVDIEVEKWSKFANKEKFTLCRCGNSKNKPFCDYSHASLKDESYTF